MSVRPESECRRPDANWDDTVPIVLADGQTWHFPKPYVDCVPKFTDGKATLTFESEFKPFLTRMEESEDAMDALTARCELERHMLLKLYDLSDDELSLLLRWRSGSEADNERRQDILNTALGAGPKPTPGGDDSV